MPHDEAGAEPQDVVAELAKIAATRDWAALEALCDRLWLALPGHYGAEFLAAFDQVPEEELLQRPRLLVGWLLASYVTQDPHPRELRPLLRQYIDFGPRLATMVDPETETSAATLTVAGTLIMISTRLRGDLEDAERLGRQLTARMAQLDARPSTEGPVRPGWIAMQRGLTLSLLGDLPGAVEQYREAHELARTEPVANYAGVNAAANLAMIFAQLGHLETSQQWLSTLDSYPPPPPNVAHLLTVGGTIARGWHALDQYDWPGLDAALETVGDGTQPIELWPFGTALVGTRALHAGRAVEYLDTLHVVQLSHPATVTAQGTGLRALQRARADLLIAAGEANRALRLINDAGTGAHWLAVPAARLRLLNGDYELARALASRGPWHPVASHRDTRQLLLIKASAALRMGERDEAVKAMSAAMRLRSPDEVLSLTTVPTPEREELFALTTVPLSDTAAERLAAARPVFPEHIRLIDLTAREQAVLAELTTGATAVQIARTLVVSVNTVRTQIQSIYRKLDVSTRDTALMRASELGIL